MNTKFLAGASSMPACAGVQVTTGWLSQWHMTRWLHQERTQRIPASKIGSSSFTVMGSTCVTTSHCTWNHLALECAPQPQLLDASDAICITGNLVGVREERGSVPARLPQCKVGSEFSVEPDQRSASMAVPSGP